MFSLTGKVVLVTGGATGIGAGIVEAFLKERAKHVAFGDINDNAGKDFEQKLQAKYGSEKAQFIHCDVTKDEEIDIIFENLLKRFGYIDVVVNSAGIMTDARNILRKQIDINVTALIYSTFKALDSMRKDREGKGGTIINISSAIALFQSHMLPVYTATKSAVLQFSNCVGMEPHFSRTGVRVLTLCFGKTGTALVQQTNVKAFDDETDKELSLFFDAYSQSTESAVNGVLEAYKCGASGSTWLVFNDGAPKDITEKVKAAYEILRQTMI